MSAKSAEIIAVGTELLLGEIVNTDAKIISQGLSELGINTFYHTVVGDNPNRLINAIETAKSRADIIITTGGLGPTLDDLTKETLAHAFGKKLVVHEESMRELEEFFVKLNRPMAENNRKQAYLPEGCTVFKNDWGTAPACAFESGNHTVVMLPGPPRECEPLFRQKAMKYLAKFSGGAIYSTFIRTFGIGESDMEARLHDKMASSTNPSIAPYAKENEALVRVTAKAETEEKAREMTIPVVREVCDVLDKYVYGIDATSLEQVVVDELIRQNITVSFAESCTGGLVSKRVTDIAGSSKIFLGSVVTYSNEMKQKLVNVKAETLEKYGAVSEQTALEMAEGVAKLVGSEIGIGITGIAGPDGGTDEKPIGLVYIALYRDGKTTVRKLNAVPKRERVRNTASSVALDMLRRELNIFI